MNMAKPSEVTQRETESPSEFYERLYEAYGLYANRSSGRWISDGDLCSLCVSSLPQYQTQTSKGRRGIDYD